MKNISCDLNRILSREVDFDFTTDRFLIPLQEGMDRAMKSLTGLDDQRAQRLEACVEAYREDEALSAFRGWEYGQYRGYGVASGFQPEITEEDTGAFYLSPARERDRWGAVLFRKTEDLMDALVADTPNHADDLNAVALCLEQRLYTAFLAGFRLGLLEAVDVSCRLDPTCPLSPQEAERILNRILEGNAA